MQNYSFRCVVNGLAINTDPCYHPKRYNLLKKSDLPIPCCKPLQRLMLNKQVVLDTITNYGTVLGCWKTAGQPIKLHTPILAVISKNQSTICNRVSPQSPNLPRSVVNIVEVLSIEGSETEATYGMKTGSSCKRKKLQTSKQNKKCHLKGNIKYATYYLHWGLLVGVKLAQLCGQLLHFRKTP